MPRGFFITFEGLDGSGKTTQLRRLAASLEAAGKTVVTSATPAPPPWATASAPSSSIPVLNRPSARSLPPPSSPSWFADRAQSIAEVIAPALADGAIVLCDRFTDSSEAYQGAGRGLGQDRVLALHNALCPNLQPDLTLLLLPALEVSLTRARRRNQHHLNAAGTDENRFERESDDFYARIHAAYLDIAIRDPHRVLTLTDNAPIDTIELQIRAAVQTRLP